MNQSISRVVTLSADEVANLLHCSTKTVLEKAGLGEIPGAKVGKSWLFRLHDIEAYLNEEIDRQTQARKNRYSAPDFNQPQARSYSEPVKKKQSYPDLSPYRAMLKP